MTTATLTRPHTPAPTTTAATGRKRCILCDLIKPLDDFDKASKTHPNRRRGECKPCRRDQARERKRLKAEELSRLRNTRIRDVLADHPDTATAALHLGVTFDTADTWKRALRDEPDKELKVTCGLRMGAEPESTASDRLHGLERPHPGWRLHAACRDQDTDLWYGGPDQPGQATSAQARNEHADAVAEAKKTCKSCPVKAACLTEALLRNEQGIWGGLDDDERRAYKARLRRRPTPPEPNPT